MLPDFISRTSTKRKIDLFFCYAVYTYNVHYNFFDYTVTCICFFFCIQTMASTTSVSKHEMFITDLDFCPRCGTVLPLPGTEDVVRCRLCSFCIDVRGVFDYWNIFSFIFISKYYHWKSKKVINDSSTGV